MKSAGAAFLGAAAIGLLVLATNQSQAAEVPDDGVDFDVDAEVQLAMNYYANSLTNPDMWSDGQLKSLEGLLVELGFTKEATNVKDMRIGLYGDHPEIPAAPLPDLQFIPATEIDAIADQLESQSPGASS